MSKILLEAYKIFLRQLHLNISLFQLTKINFLTSKDANILNTKNKGYYWQILIKFTFTNLDVHCWYYLSVAVSAGMAAVNEKKRER